MSAEPIDAAFEDLARLDDARQAVLDTIDALDRGELRVADKVNGDWIVHEWVKRAIILYFRIAGLDTWHAGPLEFYDKDSTEARSRRCRGEGGAARNGPVRGILRTGCRRHARVCQHWRSRRLGHDGRHLGDRRLVCPDRSRRPPVGRRRHRRSLGAAVGAAGDRRGRRFHRQPLHPRRGVIIEAGAVLGANTTITASTPIIDVTGSQPVEHRGRVPANSVVIPGTRPKQFPRRLVRPAMRIDRGQAHRVHRP